MSTRVAARPDAQEFDLQPHFAIVEKKLNAGRERLKDFRMGQADPLLVAGTTVNVKPEQRTLLQGDASSGESTKPEFRPLQIQHHTDGSSNVALDGADDIEALLVVCVRAVAEVQAKNICSSLVQTPNDFWGRTCGPERGDDLCITLSTHSCIRGYEAGLSCLSRTRIARKSLTLVSVGPVIT